MDKTTKLIKFADQISNKYAQNFKNLDLNSALTQISVNVLSLALKARNSVAVVSLALIPSTNNQYIKIITNRAYKIQKLVTENDPRNLNIEVKTFIEDIKNIKLENAEPQLSELAQLFNKVMSTRWE